MPARKALDLVIRLSTDRRDNAALALGGSRRQTDAAQRKLQMLSQYLQDYVARLNGGLEAGSTDAVRIVNTRAFIDKLALAVAQQRSEVSARESHANACARLLTANEVKLNALQTLRERQDSEARVAESRREQKRTDEFGARAARSRGANIDFPPA